MSESVVFLRNLAEAFAASGMSMAELSRKAGLNQRAVKDLLDGRVESPRLSTVVALSRALGRDPGEMMGLGRRVQITGGLADFLAQYDEGDQERFLSALVALSGQRR